MAHPRRRSLHAPNWLAGGVARSQTSSCVHWVAPYRWEYSAERWLWLFGKKIRSGLDFHTICSNIAKWLLCLHQIKFGSDTQIDVGKKGVYLPYIISSPFVNITSLYILFKIFYTPQNTIHDVYDNNIMCNECSLIAAK